MLSSSGAIRHRRSQAAARRLSLNYHCAHFKQQIDVAKAPPAPIAYHAVLVFQQFFHGRLIGQGAVSPHTARFYPRGNERDLGQRFLVGNAADCGLP
jgi:hypothetical protein